MENKFFIYRFARLRLLFDWFKVILLSKWYFLLTLFFLFSTLSPSLLLSPSPLSLLSLPLISLSLFSLPLLSPSLFSLSYIFPFSLSLPPYSLSLLSLPSLCLPLLCLPLLSVSLFSISLPPYYLSPSLFYFLSPFYLYLLSLLDLFSSYLFCASLKERSFIIYLASRN